MVSTVFQIEVEPVNDFITVEGLEVKLRRMAGGVGLRVLSARQVEVEEEASIQARLFSGRESGQTEGVSSKGVH